MNLLPLKFAARYLVSKKSTNAINIITIITMVGMGVISFALVTILSVFNGFEQLNVQLNDTFNPDLSISPKEGKVFTLSAGMMDSIKAVKGVDLVSQVLLENAALKHGDHEFIGTLKGVDGNYDKVTKIDSAIIRGSYVLEKGGISYAVLGAGVERNLGVDLDDPFSTITLLVPNRGKNLNLLNPSAAFMRSGVHPAGSFSIQMDYDMKYVILPLGLMRSLLKYDNELSALEIKVKKEVNPDDVRNRLAALLGPDFVLKDRFQQNETLYKVIQTEKLVLFAILAFVLAIAGFNILGSLTMLVLEKTKDIAILKAMGADNAMVRRIFLFEGLLASLIGSFSGILLAIAVCWVQIHFKIIKLSGSGSFIIDAYPVKMKAMDFVWVLLIVVAISVVAAWLPAQRAAKYTDAIKEG